MGKFNKFLIRMVSANKKGNMLRYACPYCGQPASSLTSEPRIQKCSACGTMIRIINIKETK
jgi:ribosomal protein L37AE/L43A